jgi:hypothetical protein
MKTRSSAILFFLIASAAVYAQMGPPPGMPPGGPPRRAFGPGAFGPHPGKTVTGAPYSADVTNSLVRNLADGNSIQRTTTGHVARDNDGRTYSQETITGGFLGQNGPTTLVFISDPVAGYSYVLNASTKVARRRTLKQFQGGAGPRGPREHDRPANPNVVTADLGTQLVNGVNAQGKSTTRTIPAGAMGNAQPLVSTSEIWYSPDLQVVVASKRNNPMNGQSNYALTNIQRTAPNPSLFQVPSDYTVQDEPAGRGFGPGRRRPGPPPPAQ